MRNKNDDPFSDLLRSLEENLEKGGVIGPPEDRPARPTVQGNPRRFLPIIILLLLLFLFSRSLGFITDWIWFGSVGYRQVFITGYWAWAALFGAGALLFWLFYIGNVVLARRMEMQGLTDSPIEQFADAFGTRISSLVLLVSIIFSVVMGLALAGNWREMLFYLNQSDFGLTDKQFGRDVSFYMFTLPIWEIARGWSLFGVLLTLVSCAVVSGIFGGRNRLGRRSLIHLSLLLALLLLIYAWQFSISGYQLVFSEFGAVFGIGYTDANARLPAYNLLLLLTVIAAVLIVTVAVLRRGWQAIALVVGIWLVANVLASGIYPRTIQSFRVSPNELNLERPYIATNIEFTRRAFDLDTIEDRPYDGTQKLTASNIIDEADTIRNARLWDYRALLPTYRQVQEKAQFYEFSDIDIDRYVINGERRQVMLSAREIVPDRLNETAKTWVNRKLVYTHGYGVAMSSVAEISGEGLPQFLIKDFPVQGVISITQPQIYFGELTDEYVIARTNQREFDYPSNDNSDVSTQFSPGGTGGGGIPMTLLNRLLFALHLADTNLMLNRDIQTDSRLLWRRNLTERISRVAPFLLYDSDPYVVIGQDGKLYWVLDAYTVSNRFPSSEPLRSTTLQSLRRFVNVNYIRNSVKIVTDAYDGTMNFYLVDPNEPIAATLGRSFPTLFKPISEMPEFLRAHLRYPVDLYSIQAEVYRIYHMTDPDTFFQKEDVWDWPVEILTGTAEPIEPYYVMMQLPDSDELDFVLILPFAPAQRDNMVAWLAAQNDPAKYGQKIIFRFGRENTIFGPKQIESRIDQDPEISSQLTLWNQQGSSVIRGNMIVLPIAGGLLYVEPIYLQAQSNSIPELKRVILATADRVVMAENLGLALQQLFGRAVLADPRIAELARRPVRADDEPEVSAPQAPTVAGEGPDLSTSTVEELVTLANQQYERAQTAQRDGDWAAYGVEIGALQSTLQRLAEITGVQLAAPTPTGEPATAPTTEAEATATPVP